VKSGNILLTGATGFLGKEVLRQLLDKTDYNIFILSRAKAGVPYNVRIPLVTYDLSRITFIEGDIQQDGVFSLSSDRKYLENVIDEVIHMAASVDFQESRRTEIMSVNVDGTLRLLSQLHDFKKHPRLAYVSTCYVSGILSGPFSFKETDRANGSGFKNPYEESKSKAEALVQKSGIPHIILRPSIIIGSSDGSYYDNKTIYALFSALLTAKASFIKTSVSASSFIKTSVSASTEIGSLIQQPCDIKSPLIGGQSVLKNMIPVDVAAKMLVDIVQESGEPGKVYHLAYPRQSKVGDIVSAATRFLNMSGIYLDMEENIDSNFLSRPGQFLLHSLEPYKNYMSFSDPMYGMQNTCEVVGPEYLKKLPIPDTHFFMKLYDRFYQSFWKARLKRGK
jgi:nucleoside-diphosphate-sugar epimerase